MRKSAATVLGALACLVIGAAGGAWLAFKAVTAQPDDRTIAMSWGDGKYGKDFYGAQVYVIPDGAGYSVRARVHIGPGNGYYHDCGEIGRAGTVPEAVERWGKVRWEPEGLYIGDRAAGEYHLPRSRIESHR